MLLSPEREPFRSWKNRAWFWAKAAGVPAEHFADADFRQQTGPSTDGIFGAMMDSKQVHKLPVPWLTSGSTIHSKPGSDWPIPGVHTRLGAS